MRNLQFTFDEDDIKDIKISFTGGNDGDSEIIKMLFVTPLKEIFISPDYEETENSITVHTLPEKGEKALHQMAVIAYSVFKCLKDSVDNNIEVMEALKKLNDYMDELKEKSYQEIFGFLKEEI
jgi:hypothetical protein